MHQIIHLSPVGCFTPARVKTVQKKSRGSGVNGLGHGSHPTLTTRDRELVSVLGVRIEPIYLNPRPLTPQSVTLPTLPRAGYYFDKITLNILLAQFDSCFHYRCS